MTASFWQHMFSSGSWSAGVRLAAAGLAVGLLSGVHAKPATADESSVAGSAQAAGGEDSQRRRVSSDDIINFINEQIRQVWADNEVKPSPVASDEEWLRRVYLDIVGHVPPADVVEKFLADKDKAKRSTLIDALLDDDAYVRNGTTIWTNLCIGQQTPDRVSRVGMAKFFREAFYKDRPWNEVVRDLIAAEGHFEENGAVNYLLAQMTMRDQGVQATAKTTRLFLGIQVQCTQCHNHPFNDWKQDQFWEFNAFFRQLDREDYRKYDPQSGRMVDDYSELRTDFNVSPDVFFENRQAVKRVAYPKYFGKEIDPDPQINRREEFARLVAEGEDLQLARAMVNRMWGHFFGYGFTKPVDDMGPHNPASHPELVERLAEEFARSGYQVKTLIRWIAGSEAYQLTSRFSGSNEIDNPAAGETPLFSHLYVKMMTAEQLYDSLIIATEAHKSGRSSWAEAERQRQEWLQQFVVAFGTDENDEATTFNGSIPQALMMMNGPLVENAVNINQGGFLYAVLADKSSPSEKVQRLYLAALSRRPTRNELNAANQLIRQYPNPINGYQDLFWALLNANEFVLVH